MESQHKDVPLHVIAECAESIFRETGAKHSIRVDDSILVITAKDWSLEVHPSRIDRIGPVAIRKPAFMRFSGIMNRDAIHISSMAHSFIPDS